MPKTIEECRQNHGADIITAEAVGEKFAFRKPRGREMRTFLAGAASGSELQKEAGRIFDAFEDIVKDCCVSHNPQELDDLLERNPLLFEEIGEPLIASSKEMLAAMGKGSKRSSKRR